MSRTALFFMLWITAIENCFALKCYASDFNLQEKKINSGYKLRDCDNYINEIRRFQKKSQGEINFEMSCFTNVITEGGEKAVVKGCCPKNTCAKLEAVFVNKTEGGSAKCVECDSEGCNSGAAKDTIFLLFSLFLSCISFALINN